MNYQQSCLILFGDGGEKAFVFRFCNIMVSDVECSLIWSKDPNFIPFADLQDISERTLRVFPAGILLCENAITQVRKVNHRSEAPAKVFDRLVA